MDGLVSTGNKIPDTILKIIFTTKKKNQINFMHIFFCICVDIDKSMNEDQVNYIDLLSRQDVFPD